MNSYAFFTDSDSDLPFRFVDELELNMVYMPYMVDGKEYFDDLGRNGKEKEFFDAMRKGAAPVTSLLPTAAYEEYFEPVFAAGRDILFVAFSSQLSGTIQNIYAAREELLQRYPERRMIVVDTLSISLPQSILVLKAHELYRQGRSGRVAGREQEPLSGLLHGGRFDLPAPGRTHQRRGRYRRHYAGSEAHHHRGEERQAAFHG